MYPADLNSPRQELSNGGLGIVVALLVCWQIDFCRIILEVQSSCICQCRVRCCCIGYSIRG